MRRSSVVTHTHTSLVVTPILAYMPTSLCIKPLWIRIHGKEVAVMACLEAIIKQFPLQVTSFRRPSPWPCPRNFGISFLSVNFLFRHHTWEFQVFGDGKTTQLFPGNRMHIWVVFTCQDAILKKDLPMRFLENGQLYIGIDSNYPCFCARTCAFNVIIYWFYIFAWRK